METNLLDRMLNAYLAGGVAVTVTLQNKVRVSGKIKAFDGYVVVLEGQKQEILYRHAIASVMPLLQAEQHRQASSTRSPFVKDAAKPSRQNGHKPRPAHQPASASTQSINNSMKDGLLKWMQEQQGQRKAAK